jgi:hypothetical protein
MTGNYEDYTHEDQKNYLVWPDFYPVFRIYFWLRIPEGCNGKKEFHDAKKIGNVKKQPL